MSQTMPGRKNGSNFFIGIDRLSREFNKPLLKESRVKRLFLRAQYVLSI
jgi:hypothetical protein